MSYRILRFVFIIILTLGCVAIKYNLSFYPCIRFSEFRNHQKGLPIDYKRTRVIDSQTKDIVNIGRVTQPYDKIYYLLSLKGLSNENTSAQTFLFMKFLVQLKGTEELDVIIERDHTEDDLK